MCIRDSLLSDKQVAIRDKELLEKFEAVQQINGDERKVIDRFLDMAIRDFKTRKNYAV